MADDIDSASASASGPQPPPAAANSAQTPSPTAPTSVMGRAWNAAVTRWIALLVTTAAVIYLCWLIAAPFLDVIIWAVVLVVAFWPLHRRVQTRVKSEGWAAAVSSLLVIVTILVPLFLAGLALVHDAARLGHALQANKDNLLDVGASPLFNKAISTLERYVDVDRTDVREYFLSKGRQLGSLILARSLGVLSGAVGTVVQAFMVVFTMFYLFRDGPRMRAALSELLPLERRQAHEIFVRTKEVILASVYGSLVIAAIQGTLGGLAFWVLGLPSAFVWGLVMILLSIIPMAGSAIVWAPAAIYLAATGHWWKAALLTVWGAGVIGTIDNFLRPRLVGQRSRLHDLVVFFSVIGGIQAFGVLGVITGPVIAALALALVNVWRETRRDPTHIDPSAVASTHL